MLYDRNEAFFLLIRFRDRISNIRLKLGKSYFITRKNYSSMETDGKVKLQPIFTLIICTDSYIEAIRRMNSCGLSVLNVCYCLTARRSVIAKFDLLYHACI